jgi:3-deoxy-7-phosphoheptulonate synthase
MQAPTKLSRTKSILSSYAPTKLLNSVKRPQRSNVLEESKKIANALLEVQKQVEKSTQITEHSLLEAAKQKLGYVISRSNPAISKLIDTRISGKTPVVTPKALSEVLPVSAKSLQTTETARDAIIDILRHNDTRLIVIVGPCSIHDSKAALEYAGHVKEWRKQFGDNLEIIMRAYMEKPRTELGWKGFVYDPFLDESDDINVGLVATRMLACKITDMGVPIAMERLNALTPQYVNALVAYDTIGSRNTTDQKSREYASGTSSPVGFKNPPDGSIKATVQAVVSARGGHAFLGMDMNGAPSQINSKGNDTAHIILRGGDRDGPNYEAKYIADAKKQLHEKGLPEAIIVDASHGNSEKQASRQKDVIADVSGQVRGGETAIVGVMIESNLVAGAQKLGDPAKLVYGQSITDECIDVDETENLLAMLAEASAKRSG